MAKTKVKQDRHSLYVKAGGYIFRPVVSKYTYMYGQAIQSANHTQYKEGQVVSAKHTGESLGVVGEEVWHSHGAYFQWDNVRKKNYHSPSEELFTPQPKHT